MNLGLIIREARVAKGMTQLELANKLGYESMQFVSLFERGLSKVPHVVIGKLVVILGINEKTIIKEMATKFQNDLRAEIQKGKEGL